MTIIERALELVPNQCKVGLGSGRAAERFVRALGERVRAGRLDLQGVATSQKTANLAAELGIRLVTLADAGTLDLTIDGADEVDGHWNLIKGYGRALIREKIVANSSRQLVILVGTEKLVPQLGTRGKLPVEIVPFALPLCERRLRDLGCHPTLWTEAGQVRTSDNGNFILDCSVAPIADPIRFESDIRAIPGVVGTGLFLGMASLVLVEDKDGREVAIARSP
jgi:ribose 5-phosphate isomerase A